MSKYQEQWKQIEEYPNYYISNYGRVKSFSRSSKAGRIIKLGYNDDGYNQVLLYKNGKRKTFRVCRLVGIYFVKGYKTNLVINHIDKNRKNDYFKNLEWTTIENNVRYSKSRKVKSIDDNNNEKIYNSLTEAQKEGFNVGNIWRSCNKQIKHKGLRWEYVI